MLQQCQSFYSNFSKAKSLTTLNSKDLTALFLFTFSAHTMAIDETESLRQRSQDKTLFTNLSLDLSGKSGNSDTENFEFGLYHSQRHDKHFGFIMASREYAKSNGAESANSSFLHFRYNYYFAKEKSFELFTQSNFDDFRSLESRNLLGISYRQEFHKTHAFGAGLFNEHEKYLVNDDPTNFTQTRANLYWVFAKPLSKYANLANTLYYQPNIEEFGDWRAFNKFSINSALTENLYLKFGVLIEHNSQPVLDVEKTDISYRAGFEFEF
ncbi:DUF481 domain-containing protein [Psychrosphaera sp. B3R10]|uniref:DUF481 domain-containing protein n=1 Tax=unclassified Psychrosphaera TaxID=2641570 RepID=UPI001C09A2F1|nr:MULTISPECIES: DUF481 domain-containing protein [unclassified Psychrosphaera]MBU2882608.1 DUF481 domain-containing protein [Psychrosphaera sp. I2R16]MBU2989373.1 DUF481 domain-containing protein [Psychrosphaera sp. B3R10]